MANEIDALFELLEGLDASAPLCVLAYPDSDGEGDAIPQSATEERATEQSNALETKEDACAHACEQSPAADGSKQLSAVGRAVADAGEDEEDDTPAKKGKDGLMPAKKRPFALRMGCASERTRTLFGEVLNRFAYYGVRGRAAAGKMNFKHKGVLYGRLSFSGKTLRLHLPLSCAVYDVSVYGHEDYSAHRGFEAVPFTVKLSNKKLLPRILELIDNLMRSVGLEPKKKPVVHDVAAEYPTDFSAFEQKGYGYLLRESVTREDVAVLSPRFAAGIVQTRKLAPAPERFITATVSLDTLGGIFADGASVDVAILREKGLVVSNANRLVVTAAERLERRLDVVADEIEPSAVAQLCLVGGSATVVVYVG